MTAQMGLNTESDTFRRLESHPLSPERWSDLVAL